MYATYSLVLIEFHSGRSIKIKTENYSLDMERWEQGWGTEGECVTIEHQEEMSNNCVNKVYHCK